MGKNRKLETRVTAKAEQKERASEQWHLSVFRYNAGILPALLLLASPFSGIDTSVFSHMKHLNSGLEQCRRYRNE